MSYTAIESMRKTNRRRFGADVGPAQPPLYTNRRNRNDLKSAALRFLHQRCEGLRFDMEKEKAEADTGVFLGKSLKSGQIPYNMQMDLNRLCLEKALETFIDSGVAEDAYAVYYCYLEIFFGQYGRSKKMVELLSEYEANGSSLLMKHRDHYSHSVYVFALGLAIYETNESYRRCFRAFYRLEDRTESDCADLFLEFWGLAALFHDIGYPFELPFEQVLSYFEVDRQARGKGSLYLAYHDVEALTGLDEGAKDHFRALYGKRFETTSALLAHDLAEKLGEAYDFSEEYLLDVLDRKPSEPNRFGYFMDHAFFSAARLYRELARTTPRGVTKMHVDALSAIVLHNSLFKFSISFYKDKEKRKPPLKASLHPLAWMLMLCDELQCWDRTAYGRSSRTELHPMAAEFDFSGGAIRARYDYERSTRSTRPGKSGSGIRPGKNRPGSRLTAIWREIPRTSPPILSGSWTPPSRPLPSGRICESRTGGASAPTSPAAISCICTISPWPCMPETCRKTPALRRWRRNSPPSRWNISSPPSTAPGIFPGIWTPSAAFIRTSPWDMSR